MRVAYFASNFFSPSVTFILDQVTGLLERGVDVQVFTGAANPGDIRHEDFARHNLQDRIHEWPSGIRTFGALLDYARQSIAAARAPRLRPLLPYDGRRLWRGLTPRALTVLAGGPFDVAVAHFGNLALTVQALRDVGALTAPLVTFFHAVDVSRFVAQRGPDVYERLFAKGDLMLPISDYCQRKLVELGCSESKLLVHRMGVDLPRLSFVPRTLRQGETAQILTIARLTEKKGIRYALQALSRLKRGGRPFHYHVVGDGPQRATLEQLIRSEGLGELVTLHGWKSREQLASLQSTMHLCLAPSVTAADGDQEGIPVALMEAMAVGMPVISTWHAGIPELVQSECGLLVPERDPDAIHRALAQLLAAPERWSSLTHNAHTIVARDYDIGRLNDVLLQRLSAVSTARSVA